MMAKACVASWVLVCWLASVAAKPSVEDQFEAWAASIGTTSLLKDAFTPGHDGPYPNLQSIAWLVENFFDQCSDGSEFDQRRCVQGLPGKRRRLTQEVVHLSVAGGGLLLPFDFGRRRFKFIPISVFWMDEHGSPGYDCSFGKRAKRCSKEMKGPIVAAFGPSIARKRNPTMADMAGVRPFVFKFDSADQAEEWKSRHGGKIAVNWIFRPKRAWTTKAPDFQARAGSRVLLSFDDGCRGHLCNQMRRHMRKGLRAMTTWFGIQIEILAVQIVNGATGEALATRILKKPPADALQAVLAANRPDEPEPAEPADPTKIPADRADWARCFKSINCAGVAGTAGDLDALFEAVRSCGFSDYQSWWSAWSRKRTEDQEWATLVEKRSAAECNPPAMEVPLFGDVAQEPQKPPATEVVPLLDDEAPTKPGTTPESPAGWLVIDGDLRGMRAVVATDGGRPQITEFVIDGKRRSVPSGKYVIRVYDAGNRLMATGKAEVVGGYQALVETNLQSLDSIARNLSPSCARLALVWSKFCRLQRSPKDCLRLAREVAAAYSMATEAECRLLAKRSEHLERYVESHEASGCDPAGL